MSIQINTQEFEVTEHFLQYVQIDTQSDPYSESFPSTEKQKDLANLLLKQLLELGIKDAHLDEHGYVFATIPSNTDKKVPTICFCAHMDTSPDCSGFNVKPIIHKNYQGEDLILPDDPKQIIKESEHPDLTKQHGNDIITASGTTLLGADNKAGVAAIMDAARLLLKHPEIKHGDIRILFTPDEEVGRGVEKLDMKKLAADFGYTVDGETLGSIENETFSADEVIIRIQGISIHPGFAKGKMLNALKVAGKLLDSLPKDRLSPETTSEREGFIHPVAIQGTVEEVTLHFIIRDFNDDKLKDHEAELKNITETVIAAYPGCTYEFIVHEQYRNMKNVLKDFPKVTEIGIEALERLGINPILRSIRGGTDGSRLSFMGLPCPNIFAGEHAFHGKQEWVSVQDMQKAVLTIMMIAKIWEEKA
ncbi:peptidase T [Albibacterium bauzanense]|uniref:Peptidase T n=1 Tax=Albibacterium bauzanense TaxID=653929 RepID=A0A4R1LZS0_9SPHI|nr:peptidase T [Albibacterium bauzanense]TCK82749.1 tripeptide aminopeptidase [Albibacterium bauzanense]